MNINYSREGGLLGQVAQTDIQSADLPPDLQTLVEEILTDPTPYRSESANQVMRDGYRYRFNLKEGRRQIRLTFDDLSLPNDVLPLVHFLQQRTGKP